MRLKYLILALVLFLIAGCTTTTPNKTAEQNLIETQTIKIASFNIQVFGQTKIKNTEVMQIISRIVKGYDLVAIQEVRSIEENVIPTLLDYLNDANTKYDYIISERLGRTGANSSPLVC